MAKKILIIDDEELVRRALRDVLGDKGYEVDTAVDGEAGIEKIKNEYYDMVLIDIMLPGKNGVEVLRIIREIKPDIIPVILTGYGGVETAKESMKLGAFDYLAKPIESGKLVALVNGALKQRETKIVKPSIMVIDDDEIVLRSVKDVLESKGYPVETAISPAQVIAKIGRQNPHVLIVDLKLPGLSGIELIERLQSQYKFLPIIITGYPSVESLTDAMKKGVYEYITKPIKPEELVTAIAEGWEKRKGEIVIPEPLKLGRTYLIEEGVPTRAYNVFNEVVKYGFPGLYISTIHPDTLKDEYDVHGRIVWLSGKMDGKYDEKYETMNELEDIAQLLRNFLDEGKESIVLLDGLEYLTAHNDFATVLKFVHDINSLFALQKAILILPVNPHAFEEKEMILLERSVEVVHIDVEKHDYWVKAREKLKFPR